jgi:cytoplasmic iron level regulating protein YaaA (DUF328/UPF0246 family)
MNTKNQILADKKINDVFKKIDFNKLEGKSKLLIIPCSDKKRSGGTDYYERNYFNSDSYKYLQLLRGLRKHHYLEFINTYPNKFNKSKDINGDGHKIFVDKYYFVDLLNNNNNFQPAFWRYDGEYYSDDLRELYFLKNRESNLHILIVSGLYGVLEFRDEIIDYHLKINYGPNLWGNCLTDTINKYVEENEIEHDAVFYSLSDEYLKKIKPNRQWKNLWINKIENSRQANLEYSADCVLRFLNLL